MSQSSRNATEGVPYRRRTKRRRGISLVLVLGLVAITLALSYALLRTQTTAVQLQANTGRQADARQAALAGLSAAIRKMHAADWAGVDVPLQGNLDSVTSYQVTFDTGDAALTSGSADYAEYPFRVTATSTGYATDPARPNSQASYRVSAVLQLVRRKMGAEPSNWQTLQQYTVYQWGDTNTYIQFPVRVQGPTLLQGSLQICTDYPGYDSARDRYLDDLEKMRVAGLGDNRPFDGPVNAPNSRSTGAMLNLLKNNLNLTVNNISATSTQPLASPGLIRTYRLYPGGKLYTIPTLQSQFGSTLANRTLAADPTSNPLGLFPCDGTLTLNNNVTIEGTLVSGGSTPDVLISGTGVTLRGRDLPLLYGATGHTQLPAALLASDLRVKDAAQGTLTGLAIVWDEFEFSRSDAAMKFDLKGRLITRQLRLLGRTSWDFDWVAWWLFLNSFGNQLDNAQPILYFPQWLQANLGLQTKPLLTIGPDSSGVAYHWQDFSQPVYVADPADGGLRWDLVRWKDNP